MVSAFRRTAREIRRDGSSQTLVESGSGAEAESLLRARRIQLAARLSVRLRRIPDDAACEADGGGDLPHQILDGDFLAGSEVHRIAAVVLLRGEQNGVRRVLHVEELAGRGAVAPHLDLARAALERVDAFQNQRRNDV